MWHGHVNACVHLYVYLSVCTHVLMCLYMHVCVPGRVRYKAEKQAEARWWKASEATEAEKSGLHCDGATPF